MHSPGAKTFGGWVRYTLRFLRLYSLGLVVLLLLLLAINLIWPEACLREHLRVALHPILSTP